MTSAWGGLCLEKSVETPKDFAPWKEWIKAIRAYGMEPSDALGDKEEALILAQSMEDNGCGFLANLSAQNMSLGGLLQMEQQVWLGVQNGRVLLPTDL